MVTTPPRRRRVRPLSGLAAVAVVATALLTGTVIAIVGTWMVRGGPAAGLQAMARLLRHGPTTVDDFRLYPARRLLPSPTPRPLADGRTASPLPLVPDADGHPVALDRRLADTATLALLVVRDGRVVYRYDAPGRAPGEPSQIFSVSKTVLSALLGLAMADGRLRSLDQPVGELVPELAARFPALTLRHLVDMRSGIDYTEDDNPFGRHVLLNYTTDVPHMVLALRPAAPPGGEFVYRSGDTALLSLALQRALGDESLTAFAQRRLWTPLGMEDPALWTLDRDGGFEKAWCCLAVSARDLVKLGRLVLDGGVVDGRPWLSPAWMAEWTRLPVVDGRRRYHQSWWPASARGGDVVAAGKDGQFLYVDPDTGTVVVRLGRSDGGLYLDEWADLFAALGRHPW